MIIYGVRKGLGVGFHLSTAIVFTVLIVIGAVWKYLFLRENVADSAWMFLPAIGVVMGALSQVAGFPIYVGILIVILGFVAHFTIWRRR